MLPNNLVTAARPANVGRHPSASQIRQATRQNTPEQTYNVPRTYAGSRCRQLALPIGAAESGLAASPTAVWHPRQRRETAARTNCMLVSVGTCPRHLRFAVKAASKSRSIWGSCKSRDAHACVASRRPSQDRMRKLAHSPLPGVVAHTSPTLLTAWTIATQSHFHAYDLAPSRCLFSSRLLPAQPRHCQSSLVHHAVAAVLHSFTCL
jgi:hypothetical protein